MGEARVNLRKLRAEAAAALLLGPRPVTQRYVHDAYWKESVFSELKCPVLESDHKGVYADTWNSAYVTCPVCKLHMYERDSSDGVFRRSGYK